MQSVITGNNAWATTFDFEVEYNLVSVVVGSNALLVLQCCIRPKCICYSTNQSKTNEPFGILSSALFLLKI